MSKKLNPGDIGEINVHERWYYIQYLGPHPELIDCVLVIPRVFRQQQTPEQLVFGDECYPAFYPLRLAVRQKLVKIVVNRTCSRSVPKVLRRPGMIDRDGQIHSWMIDKADGTVDVRQSLSETEKQIPVAGGWNHEMLLLKIESGWRPCDCVDRMGTTNL